MACLYIVLVAFLFSPPLPLPSLPSFFVLLSSSFFFLLLFCCCWLYLSRTLPLTLDLTSKPKPGMMLVYFFTPVTLAGVAYKAFYEPRMASLEHDLVAKYGFKDKLAGTEQQRQQWYEQDKAAGNTKYGQTPLVHPSVFYSNRDALDQATAKAATTSSTNSRS
jgi:hypothetical protein